MKTRKIAFLLLILVMPMGLSMAKEEPTFVGVSKCKSCHMSPKFGGMQYQKWSSLKHANAYESLKSERAKEIAALGNVSDPLKSDSCLKCHVTTLSVKDEKMLETGVSCERCHGPGSEYKTMKIMKDHQAALDAGLRPLKDPNKETMMKNIEALCRECHGLEHKDNPAAQEFNFEESWEKIRHDKEALKKEFPDKYN